VRFVSTTSVSEPLGRGVYRRREPGRPCAHDDNVAHFLLVDSFVEPQAVRYLRFVGLRRTVFAPADDHGNLCRRDLEPVQYFLNARIVVEINIRVWVSIAGKKLSDPQCPSGIAVTREALHRLSRARSVRLGGK